MVNWTFALIGITLGITIGSIIARFWFKRQKAKMVGVIPDDLDIRKLPQKGMNLDELKEAIHPEDEEKINYVMGQPYKVNHKEILRNKILDLPEESGKFAKNNLEELYPKYDSIGNPGQVPSQTLEVEEKKVEKKGGYKDDDLW